MFVRMPGEPVAANPSEVSLQLTIAAGDAGKEGAPLRAVTLGGNGRLFRAVILTARCILLPGAKVDSHGVNSSQLNTSGSVSH